MTTQIMCGKEVLVTLEKEVFQGSQWDELIRSFAPTLRTDVTIPDGIEKTRITDNSRYSTFVRTPCPIRINGVTLKPTTMEFHEIYIKEGSAITLLDSLFNDVITIRRI